MPIEDARLELRLVGDIAGSFRVARYQRGYRWGRLEVERLLNDIWESKGEPYSLQPVVVKRDSKAAWELVDGQQRLTTLFLIFVFMQREGLQNAGPPYSITYDTRPESEGYLKELDANRADSNIDYFHLHRAYDCIRVWFDTHGARRQYAANKFYDYLFESVRVIWYEAPKDLDSTTLFTRLNVGKIPLTDAELFKALLLSRSRGGVGRTDRSHEIAAQWDSIERDLQHPDVWAFVADEAFVESPTRINLLLDTLAGGPRGRARPRFHTFDVLRQMVEQDDPSDVWNRVVELHSRVLGWYENRGHYHKIGYLVAVGECFSDLVALADGKTKSEFGAILDARIRETLDLTPSEVAALGYENDTHRDKCARVLLLMNVETVRRQNDSSERYPFRIHRSGAWSLEHIHAQNAELLTKAEQWTEWLRLHREALLELPSIEKDSRDKLLGRIDDVGEQIDRQIFQDLARDMTAAFTLANGSTAASSHSVHSVSNLALLASGHNSALNNAVFEVKRRRILALDRKGSYIPICTRQVFLKYYTDADAQQVHFWGTRDREAYLNTILSRAGGVGAYLKPEVPLS
ncbi:MAG: DUF262 domain-containing protein [Paraburkholderia sp.]|uniref:DUF262 domain-containing protein n=1 Tax=Paraburkholderia sp. TaxID=1926495 RepID=UPI00122A9A2A|nr:DUF262 domain-containing protein [Paraburkholderia sp.]TAL98650.1 MAG: DUF262 domain-containing protein [Paraburkholderia sp.]